MRTTIDLPEDLHRIASSIARDRHQSLSQAVSDLVRAGLGRQAGGARIASSERTGLPVVDIGGPVTGEDVRSLDDE